MNLDYDFIIIGSGFGGSVSALRLAEKGYRVLVLEKGKRFKGDDFPKTNWNLKRWLWLPALRFFGIFKLSFFRHVTVLSGVGVGGGSLVYANTLPVPKDAFFNAPSWAHLANWKKELMPFYQLARKMLGTTTNPRLETGDLALQKLAVQLGKADRFRPTEVAVYFGDPEVEVADPYFNGQGPARQGCRFCGGCMIGCRYNAKNTLDKNYLYLAEKRGVHVRSEAEVYDLKPLNGKDGSTGYRVYFRQSTRLLKKRESFTSRGVVLAGGVLGTVPLLLKLRKKSLPNLSKKVGFGVRTNSESLIGITTTNKQTVFSQGIAIGSILQTDEHSHLEPVRYPEGSGFWRLLMSPMISGSSFPKRFFNVVKSVVGHPITFLRTYLVDDWAKRTQILLFMQSIDSTLRFNKGFFGVTTTLEQGKAPTAFIPEAQELAQKYAHISGGKPTTLLTESLLGIPTTAHILGGAVMGRNAQEGVIDSKNRVFGYQNLYICDGSMISANPGVNPSLTITALTERAMSFIPERGKLK